MHLKPNGVFDVIYYLAQAALPGVAIHPLAFNLVSGCSTEKQPVWLHIMHMHMLFCVLEAAATVVTSRVKINIHVHVQPNLYPLKVLPTSSHLVG